ncbi:X-linked retinitis pigmentosa GTPase regulator-like isoform X1 [Ctenopharyngodon idella]|uniref:X-linked retinitis pigmentosa GTPase regulator-like isoform X1 n=1 Tax=Ctenopharyngodon idella TaxID=7959 RepID=UPI00222F586E|nr:X-linked retinitis pigmentosa GTPase regulator-like isoform X1 [Ctenopharyngodon idella]
MTGETDTEIPDTGAVFTFGKSKISNNVPSRLWLKNDIPVHISCGQSHSAFVTEQGRLFVFGSNNSGQLGLQTKGPVTKPICVKVLKGERVQFVACGTDHTLVSTSQGEFFAAGGNSDGQLGLGHRNDSISFQRLRPFCDYAPIKLLSAGGHTSAALTEDGRLFLWGDNSVGQLGLGNDSHALLPEEIKLGQPIQWVSCGFRHSALVTDNGDVFTFGESADERLGLSAHQLANHNCPQRVESLHGVLQVACGGKHTLALTEDELYSFGRGEFGQLGLGTQMFVTDAPVAVGHFRKGRVTHVTCGENHSALITDSGLLYTFGDGRHGKLGLGDENFTNQFSPTVCQRFFDYSVMTVACGSSHMLVFARPRQQDSEEVCLEDEDVTYSYLDRCYTSMLQGQPLEHIPEPVPAFLSQLIFLPSSLPTSHRWSLSTTRARRRQRESSSAQFGPEFCNLPPLTTGFTALALTGNILQPRSPTDIPKRFKTDAPVESPSTSITLPARTPPLTPITKSTEDCHSVGTSENSMSDKTHEQHKNKMARASSIGKEENVSQEAPSTEVQAGSVSHPSMTESLPPSNLKHKKPRSGNPKNPATQEKCFSTTASQSKIQSKTYQKPIQSTNNKSKVQALEVRLSPERMSANEREGCSETRSTNTDSRHKISKVDKNSKVQQAFPRGQEVTTLAEMEQETKSGSLKIQNTSSPGQEVKQVRTMPTKVQEVKSHKIKEEGIPVRVTKRVKSSAQVQEVPSGRMEVSVVESTLQADPAQKDIKLSIGKAQEIRSTLIDTQEQGNPTSDKKPNTSKKGNEKIQVDAEENPGELTPKKAKKKRSDVQRAPMEETTPKTPSPPSVSIPTRMSKAKKRKPVEAENSNVQLGTKMLAQVKRENDSKTPQNSNISFPPIENRKSGGAAEISQSTSNLQSEHKNSQSPTDKALTEQKYEFPSIKSLTPERGPSFSSLWSNNKSATSKSSATKETESSSGNLLSPSRQHRRSPLNEIKLDAKSVEEPDRKPQAEQSIMGSVVSSLPAMAIASAAPLLIKAAEVLSETSPEQSNDMSLCASVSQEMAGNNILTEQEVDQDSTVQDVSAIEETDDSSTKKQSAQDVQNKLVLDENGKMVEEEDVRDSETEREEERGEEESLAEEEDESEGVGQKEEGSTVEDEERESDNDEESDSAQKGEEDGEEEEGEEEESEAAGEEEDDSNSRQSGKSEGEGRGDETEREEEESEGQVKEEGEDGEMEEEENKDEESGGEDEEEESESWDEGSEGEVEDEEKTDAEEEQEGESSNEEKMEVGEQSDSEDENKNVRSDEEEGESEEKDGSEEEEEEENETAEGEGEQEEKEDEESEEEDEVGNEDEEENQDEETDHEEEEGNRDQEEEEEENDEQEEDEEDKEEEVDEEENNEELKYKKDGAINSEEEEGEESVREKEEQQNEVEADADEDRERQEGSEQIEEEDEEKEEGEKEGEMDTSEVKFREEENLDISETQEEDRGDEDDEVNKPNEIMEENNEEECGSEKEAETEEEETDKKEENKKTDRGGEKQTETNEEEEEDGEEEEEETEQTENNIKSEINRKQKESSEEEEEHEESEEEEEEKEEEAEQKEIKQRETSEEEQEEESEEEEEEEAEWKDMNIKTEKNRIKQRETSEEEEQEEESEEEEEEEEAEQKEMNIKTEKNRMKQRETSEEEEQEEEGDEDEEEEEEEEIEKKDKIGRKQTETTEGEEEEEEEEEGDEDEEEEGEEEEIEKKDKIVRKQTETTEGEEEEEEEQEEEGEEEGEEEEEEEGEEEEEEGEEEKTKKVPKQRAKLNVLPAHRQTNAQRDGQKTRQRDQQNVKGKKQADSGAQDPQFWNSVLPQYLNLK